jgi:hypothetical protein
MMPGCGVLLQHALGMPPIGAMDIRNQCTGFIYALADGRAVVIEPTGASPYTAIPVAGEAIGVDGDPLADGGPLLFPRWGRRRLGYVVKKRREGVYVYLRATAPPTAVAEASRHLRISEAVLKHMVVRVHAPRRGAAPEAGLAAGAPASGEPGAVPAPMASAEEL